MPALGTDKSFGAAVLRFAAADATVRMVMDFLK